MDNTSTVDLHTGRSMPIIGLGTWKLTDDTTGTVEEALDLGYPMIDTAVDYGTQPGIGAAFERGGSNPKQTYLVSKVEEDEDAYEATKRNLRELGIGAIDLTLIHRPPPRGSGVDMWEGLIRARDEGLTTDIGVSNYSTDQIEQISDATGELPTVNQIEWTPFGWSQEMLDYCRSVGVAVQAYSPLTRARRLDDSTLAEIADSYGKTPAQVLLRWSLQVGAVPIPKANRHDHLEEDINIFDFEISDADMSALNDLNEQWSALGGRLQYT